ncbi:hypothetical protein Hanom_Chr08g00735251 [Helianthus anomalus]
MVIPTTTTYVYKTPNQQITRHKCKFKLAIYHKHIYTFLIQNLQRIQEIRGRPTLDQTIKPYNSFYFEIL